MFTSDEWKQLADSNGVICKLSGVQHHNGSGVGERYHSLLLISYQKVNLDCPEVEKETALGVSIKAMNDTMGQRFLYHPS